MSIVGPRPERPEFIELLEAVVPSWGTRLLVKPGITGWAQVRSGYAADCESTAVKLSYDLWYLRHRNLVIDLAVCAKTFFIVLGLRPLGSLRSPDERSAGLSSRRASAPLSCSASPDWGWIDRPGRPRRAGTTPAFIPARPPATPPPPVAPPQATRRVSRAGRSDPGLHLGGAPRGSRPAQGAADRAGRRHLPQPTALPEPLRPPALRGEARRGRPQGGAEPRREPRTRRWSRPRDRLRRRQPLADRRRGGHRRLGHRTELECPRLDRERAPSRLRRDRRAAARRADRAARRRARLLAATASSSTPTS